MDLGRFPQRIATISATIAKNADQLVRKVALAADAAVVTATPVDTGRARSNWITSVGPGNGGTIEPYFPGKEKSTAGVNATAAIDQGKAAIAQYRNGSSIYISNNLDYIGELNNGKSAQAPVAFVQQSVLAGVQAIKGVKLAEPGGVK